MARSSLFEPANPVFLFEYSTATPDFVHLTKFALDVKAKTLPIYEKVFDIEYPLPKLDTLVASDFDAGKAAPLLLAPSGFSPIYLKRRHGELGSCPNVSTYTPYLTF